MARARPRTPAVPQTLVIETVPLDDLHPYPDNPRDNRAAVAAVKASILEFGFRIPVVIDTDRVIVAGHTRVDAMKELRNDNPGDPRYEAVPCLVAADLTPEQLRAFRLVDNKTASLASWDFDKLSTEVTALVDAGVMLQPFGWTREELDCLSNVVTDDCLTGDGVTSAAEQGRTLATHRDNQSVRISIADLAFYVLREDYDRWADALRREHNFDLDAMLNSLAQRMGLLEAKQRRTEMLSRGRATPEAAEAFDTDAETAP